MADEKENDYTIILKVLETGFESYNMQKREFMFFRKSSQRYLAQLMLNSAIPYDLQVEELLDKYEIEIAYTYYTVIDFIIESKENALHSDLTFTLVEKVAENIEEIILSILPCPIILYPSLPTPESCKALVISFKRQAIMQRIDFRES